MRLASQGVGVQLECLLNPLSAPRPPGELQGERVLIRVLLRRRQILTNQWVCSLQALSSSPAGWQSRKDISHSFGVGGSWLFATSVHIQEEAGWAEKMEFKRCPC